MSLRPVVDAGLKAACEAATPITALNAEIVKLGNPNAGYYLRITTAGGGSNQFFEINQPFYTANPENGADNR